MNYRNLNNNKNWVWAIPLSIFLSIFPLMMLTNIGPTIESEEFICNAHITSCKETLIKISEIYYESNCIIKEYEWRLVDNSYTTKSEIKDAQTGEIIQEMKLINDISKERVLVDEYISSNCSMVNNNE